MLAANLLVQKNVDLVVVPGDIFHEARPYPAAQRDALSVFQVFTEKDIPVFAVRGNHDASYAWSQRQGGDELHVFEDLHKFTYLQDSYSEVDVHGTKVRLWGLGYYGKATSDMLQKMAEANNDKLRDNSMPNVLLAHCYLDSMGIPHDITEYELNTRAFDYIALGHYHKWWANSSGSICCTGATEHTSASEWSEADRSVAVVTLRKTRGKWAPEIERLSFKVRPKVSRVLNLGSTDSASASRRAHEVLNELDLKGYMVRLELAGSLTDTTNPIDTRAIAGQARNAFHVDVIDNLSLSQTPLQETASHDEVIREVLTKSLGVPAKEAPRWSSLVEEMKSILSEKWDTEAQDVTMKTLYRFVEKQQVPRKGKGMKKRA